MRWAWGYNNYGQHGDGTVSPKDVPTKIGTDNDWETLSTGGNHTLALKSDGTLWAWGYNNNGQIGDGTNSTTAHKTSPVRIGTDTDWEVVSAGTNSHAIKSDGSLWAWGSGNTLGDGTTTGMKSSPILIDGPVPDTTPPVSSSDAVAFYPSAPATVTVTATDEAGGSGVAAIYYCLDGGTTQTVSVPSGPALYTFAADIGISDEGTHTLEFWAEDNAGNVEDPANSVTFRVGLYPDMTPPVSSSDATSSYTASATIIITATDDGPADEASSGVAHITYILNGSEPVAVTGGVATVVAPAPGSYILEFWATDVAGNEEVPHNTVSFVVVAPDTTPPVSSSDAIAFYPSAPATVTVTATDEAEGSGVAALYYKVDGGAVETVTPEGTSPVYTLSVPVGISSEGTHTIGFWAEDNAGNIEDPSNSVTFRVGPYPDMTPPVSSSDATSSYTASATIIITATDDGPADEAVSGVAHITYILNGSAPVTVTGDVATVVAPAPGSYILEFWATDAAGNVEFPHNTVSFVVGLAPDVTPPVSSVAGAVSDPMPGAVANITITATDTAGSAHEESSGVKEITYSVNGGGPTVTASDTAAFTVSGTGIYTLEYFATDVAGNTEATRTANFYLGPVMDKTPPVSSTDATSSYTVTATVNITAADEAGGSGVDSITYTVDGTTPVVVPGTTAAVTVTIPGRDARTYTLAYFATDIAGNQEATQTVTFTVNPAPDVTPPVSVADTVSSYDTSATITITATDDGPAHEELSGVKEITYILDGGTPVTTAGDTAAVTVEETGDYTLSFFATDNAGNQEATQTATFTVRDVTPPVSSTDVKASYTASATVNITATDDAGGSGVDSITYTLDGGTPVVVPGTTAAVSVSIPGSVAHAYTLEFWAVDMAGNIEATQSVTFTIDPASDKTPPVSGSDAKSSYDTSATITITAEDAVVVGEATSGVKEVTYTLDGGTPVTTAGSTAVVTVGKSGDYTLSFFATDVEGNQEATQTVTFTVRDVTAPLSSSDAADVYASAPATVTITATDEAGGSGLAALYYRVDGGAVETVTPVGSAPVYTFAASVVITGDGTYTLEFWAEDNAGNVGAVGTATFRVGPLPDKTAPVSSSDATSTYASAPATVTITATDDGPDGEKSSGVAYITYRVNGSVPETVAGDVAAVVIDEDGSYILEFWATDAAGNIEAPAKAATFRVGPAPDKTPPVSSSDARSSYIESATIIITATDDGPDGEKSSGVAYIIYRVNASTPETVAGDVAAVVIDKQDSYTLEFWATDVAGNVEASHLVGFTVGPAPDETPPVSSSDASATYASAPATVTITATDEEGGSGLAALYYRLGEGTVETVTPEGSAPVYTLSVPVTVTDDGTYTLEFWAADNAGNQEATQSVTFRVGPAPDLTLPVSSTDATSSYVGTATVTITATDPAGPEGSFVSGVREVTYALGDEPSVVVTGSVAVVTTSEEGTHTLSFFATDNAGNQEATQTVTFTVTAAGAPDRPITATVKDKHGKAAHGYSASDTVSCIGCHAAKGYMSCTDAGCHRVAAARDLAPGELDGPVPDNHDYIRPDTYGCEGCHKVSALPGGTIERISGADRFATAIAVSKKNFESADAVIIATGMNYADALSASALAGALKAPLLLTRKDALAPGVLDEIGRLGAGEAWIMGSEAAVSAAVEDALGKAGLEVFRLEGEDRYETSAEIAWAVAEIEDEGAGFSKKAFLARGDNFADGLAASPLAYRNKIPVVLTRPTELSWDAADIIEFLEINDITILGSTAAISAGVEAEVRALDTKPAVRRLGGTDRYATAQEIAKHAFENSLATKGFIGVATGLDFPDALAGGVAAGERGGIIILTAPAALSANWVGYLPGAYGSTKPDIQLYGGNNVLSDNVMNKLKEMLID